MFPPLLTLVCAAAFGVLSLRIDAGPVGPDAALHDWLVARPSAWWVGLALGFTALGNWQVLLPVAGACALWLGRSSRRAGIQLVLATVGTGLLSLLLKVAFARPRPSAAEAIYAAGGFAYPSGHALVFPVFAGTFWLLSRSLGAGPRRAATLAVALAPAVALSRLALGLHWATDVLGGLALAGVVLGALCATWRSDPCASRASRRASTW